MVEIEIKIKDLKWVKLHQTIQIKFILQMIIQDTKIQKNSKRYKKGIDNRKIIEISDRSKAIFVAIKNLNSGEILLGCWKRSRKNTRFR